MSDPEANRALIRRFYEALDKHDGEAMAECYAPDSTFRDPVFGTITGEQAGNMWRMLTARSEDLAVELADHGAESESGHARWIARYTFGDSGRAVVNDVQASFQFSDDGRIKTHVDRFSRWAWARQALGMPGFALGWSPLMSMMLRRRARGQLEQFKSG